jgi:uroporphyrinogen decarboxylase
MKTKMTPKERVLTTLNHSEPDKIPYDSWMVPEVADQIIKLLNVDLNKDRFALAKTLGHDMLYSSLGICDGYNSIYKPERRIGENLYQDAWGIKWAKKSQEFGCYCEFVEHPLADINNYPHYKWPDPFKAEEKGFYLYEELIATCGKEYAILGGIPCTVFEAAWYLRGLENFLIDLYTNRDFAIELLNKCMDYHLAISKKLVAMGVDIIWWGDDVSCETGPLISPQLFRELLKPMYAFMIQEVRKINKNVLVAFHSDGKIGWMLDDLVEIGMNIINPLQPDVNDVAAIKKQYGKKLSFWGNVDTRNIMSHGSCSEVVNAVRNVVETLGPGGGLILASNHMIQATARAVDNTIAYYWAAEKFRNYPIKTGSIGAQRNVDWLT